MIAPRAVVSGCFLLLTSNLSCSSSNDTTCSPGQSIQCASVSGCVGAQVCKADGSGFDTCQCGSVPPGGPSAIVGGGTSVDTNYNPNVGGSGLATGGIGSAAGLGGKGATGGKGGIQAGSGGTAEGVGGTVTQGGGNATCSPRDMKDYSYPSYKPARHVTNACTEQAIQKYYAECYATASCAAFESSGSLSQCGACLTPTALSSSSYGPLLKMGTSTAYFYETNVAGCEELVGEVNCAPKMQAEFLCEYYACEDSCPITDNASYNSLFQCMSTAQASSCASLRTAANCLTSSAHVAACSGSTFEAQFLAIAKVFCM